MMGHTLHLSDDDDDDDDELTRQTNPNDLLEDEEIEIDKGDSHIDKNSHADEDEDDLLGTAIPEEPPQEHGLLRHLLYNYPLTACFWVLPHGIFFSSYFIFIYIIFDLLFILFF